MTMGHRLRSGSARRGIAFISTAALLTSMMAAPALAEHRENTTVLDADSAVEAALNWSDHTFDTSDAVIIGRDDVFADNLASGLIQGLGDGVPLLLTPTDDLVDEVAAEIEDLGATVAHVLGGEEAISEDVVDELEALGLTIHRHAGETRVETAIDIASKHATDADSAIVARAYGSSTDESQAFADSLAAGAWAAESGMPVLLTQTAELNDNLAAYLEDSAIENVTIVGGTSAVSAATASEIESLGIEVDRVSGATRFETAVAIAAARSFDSAADADTVILTEGQQDNAWAGGFAAAAFSALSGAPIVLSNGEDLPAPTVEFLEGGDAALVCGPFVEPAACDEAAEILGHEPAAHTNQSFEVTPADEATVEEGESRQYTVSGLDDEATYDILLFECEEVSIDDEGVVSFQDDNANNGRADQGTLASGDVTVVNGVSGGSTDEVESQNGTLTFTVTSSDTECVEPVVVEDANDNDALDLDANDEPTEGFGVGGESQFVPAEADAGDPAADEDITFVDKEEDFFVTASGTYFYDNNDTFQIDNGGTCLTTSQENFENNLSVGDDLDGDSVYNPDFGSTLCIQDEAPAAPTALTATDGDPTDTAIDLDWTGAAGADSYNVYANDEICADTTVAELGQIGSTDEDTTEFEATGLTADTDYCFVVTSVDDGDESPLAVGTLGDGDDNTAQEDTTPAVEQPTVDQAVLTADFPLEGIADDGDTWTLVFNEAMDPTTVLGAEINATDMDGDTIRVECTSDDLTIVAGTGGDFVTDAGCELVDGEDADGDLDTLNIELAEDAEDRNAGGDEDGDIEYALTITSIDNLTDDDDNAEPSIANSDDVVIGPNEEEV